MATRNRAGKAGITEAAAILNTFSLGLEFDESWDFDAEPVCEGTVIDFDILEVERQGIKVPVGCFVIERDGKRYAVWESKKLEKLFQCIEPGWHVRIESHGYRDLGGGRKMREFSAAVGPECTPRREVIEARITKKMRMEQSGKVEAGFNDDVPF